ncbi:pheromone-processing carboxypeptidase KEX1-like [Euphorbia lathyris]|uniref:pheromone-processing carboxypeptidase KEX1-like n=1 Tax=Euphorbia lathyris TaxID=212925 RepID=UPI003313EF3F
MDDIKNGSNWKIVQKTCPRNVYNVPETEQEANEALIFNDEPYQQYEANDGNEVEQNDLESLSREDLLPEEIFVDVLLQTNGSMEDEDFNDEEDEDFNDEEDDTVVDYLDDNKEEDEIADEDNEDDDEDDSDTSTYPF